MSLLSRCCVSLLCCVMCVRHERVNEQQQQQPQSQQREAEQRCCITRSTPDARSCKPSVNDPTMVLMGETVAVLPPASCDCASPRSHSPMAIHCACPVRTTYCPPSSCLARRFSHALSHCQSNTQASRLIHGLLDGTRRAQQRRALLIHTCTACAPRCGPITPTPSRVEVRGTRPPRA